MAKQTEIDATDARIIRALMHESRTSFTQLAKECGISIGAVRMRFAQLKKAGIITGEMMQVNPLSLGYKCICDLGIKTATENEKDVKAFLESKPYLSHIIGPFGKYNFWAKVVLLDHQKLAGILEDLESDSRVKHVDAMMWVEAINLEHVENLIIKPLDLETKGVQTPAQGNMNTERTEIDDTDRRIAQILAENSRMPFRRIAEQLGISTKNVIQRYKKLRGPLLTTSTIRIDLNKLGYKAWAFALVKVANRSKMPEIFNNLLSIPNLIVAIRYIGPYDIFATVAVADFKELFESSERIRKISGIETTEIYLGRIYPRWPLSLFHELLSSKQATPRLRGCY
ncbi:MAG: Lrp/AsnC family transcriptional regulator [Candidatus Bathyarchaeia archaeon]